MKKIITLVIVAFITINVTAQEINWVSLEEALELQKKNPKKIMMDVYTNWCGPCKKLDKYTFGNKDVAEYINKHYYAVKFNGEGNEKIRYNDKDFENPNYKPERAKTRNSPHQLTRYFGVRAYPSLIFIDEEQQFLTVIRGYKNPQQIELYLKLFKQDLHKDLTTQEAFNEYYETFVPEFKSK